MKKAIFILISMVVMLGVFQIASAGVTPGVGNQFVMKAGTGSSYDSWLFRYVQSGDI